MKRAFPSNRRPCDVLLVHPPWFRLQNSTLLPYPVGPCYVAATLEKEGIDSLVWNGDFDPKSALSIGGTNILKTDELTRAHEQYLARLNDASDPVWAEARAVIRMASPKAVGISAYSASFRAACNIARIVKQEFPGVPVVLGGVHASIDPEGCLSGCDAIDVVAVGESENTAGALFRALLEGMPGAGTLKTLRGIVFRDGQGGFARTEPPEAVTDLDALPLPARHRLIDLDKMPPHAHQSLYGFRGCPFKCIFCGSFNVFGHQARTRSAESMADEIEYVYRTYGTRYYYICDDIFLMKRKRALRFCEIMKEKRLPVYYSVQSRGEMMDPELLRALKRTGCQHIAVGVEVGDENIRKLIKKGNTVDDMRQAGKLIREAGLRMVGFFMFGFPWEGKEEMLRTADLMEEINPCIAFPYIVTPAPGTELLEIAQQMGLVNAGMDLSSFHHESPRMALTPKVPEGERREFIDRILDRFARHNRRSLRGDFFKRPLFYLAAARDAGILSSPRAFFKHVKLTLG